MALSRKLLFVVSIIVSFSLIAVFSQFVFLFNSGASEINPSVEQPLKEEEVSTDDVVPLAEPQPQPQPEAPEPEEEKLDTNPPIISQVSVDQLVAHQTKIQAEAVDEASPISAINYSIANGSGVLKQGTLSTILNGSYGTTLTVKAYTVINTTDLPTGAYTVRICASDTAGNMGTGTTTSLPTQAPNYCYEYELVIDHITPTLDIAVSPSQVVLYRDEVRSTSDMTYTVEDNSNATALWIFIMDNKSNPSYIRVIRTIQDAGGNYSYLANGQYTFKWDGKGCLWSEYLNNKYSCNPQHAFNAGTAYYYGIAVDEATLNSGWELVGELSSLGSIEIVQQYINPLKVSIKAHPGTAVYAGTKITLEAEVVGNSKGSVAYSWSGDCSGGTKSIVFNQQAGSYVCKVRIVNNDNIAEASINLKVFPYSQPKDSGKSTGSLVYTRDIQITKGKTDEPDYDFEKELEKIRKEREEREAQERKEQEEAKEKEQKQEEEGETDTDIVITDDEDEGFDYNLIWICLIPLFLLSLVSFIIMTLSWLLSKTSHEAHKNL